MVKHFVYIPYHLIVQALAEGWGRSLVYWVKMKAVYKNNIFYNAKISHIASLIGCSTTVLRYHLKILESKGLAVYRDNHWCMTGLEKLKRRFKRRTVRLRVVQEKLFEYIRAAVLDNNLRQQTFKLKSTGTSCSNDVYVNNVSERWGRNEYVGLSAFGIGKKLNRSKSTGCRIRQFLVNSKYWLMSRRYAVISIGSYDHYRGLLGNNLIKPWTKYNPLTGLIYVERFPALSINDEMNPRNYK